MTTRRRCLRVELDQTGGSHPDADRPFERGTDVSRRCCVDVAHHLTHARPRLAMWAAGSTRPPRCQAAPRPARVADLLQDHFVEDTAHRVHVRPQLVCSSVEKNSDAVFVLVSCSPSVGMPFEVRNSRVPRRRRGPPRAGTSSTARRCVSRRGRATSRRRAGGRASSGTA